MDNSELTNLIIQRFIEQYPNVDWRNFLLKKEHYISDAFIWDRTPEGGEFWFNVNKKIRIPLKDFLRIHLYPDNFINLEFYIR